MSYRPSEFISVVKEVKSESAVSREALAVVDELSTDELVGLAETSEILSTWEGAVN